MKQNIDECVCEIELKMEQLRKVAQAAADMFYMFHMQGNVIREVQERSVLGIRVRVLKGTLTIEWLRIRWVRLPGGWKPRYYHIKKGLKPTYNMTKLLMYAKDWEMEVVKETEAEFSDIRKEVKILTDLRRSLKLALKRMDVLENDNNTQC